MKRALVVDDEEDIRVLLRGLLAVQGWSVDEAASGADALERKAAEYDLIVLDERMPGMTGFETAIRLREGGFQGPLIFYTAYVTPDLERSIRSQVRGEFSLVAKPDLDRFVDLVRLLWRGG